MLSRMRSLLPIIRLPYTFNGVMDLRIGARTTIFNSNEMPRTSFFASHHPPSVHLLSYKKNSQNDTLLSDLKTMHENKLKSQKDRVFEILKNYNTEKTEPSEIEESNTEPESDSLSLKEIKASSVLGKKELKEKILNSLEEEGWKTFESKIHLSTVGEQKEFKNELIPANKMKLDVLGQPVSIFAEKYKDGSGVSCYSNNRNTTHAANLWSTKLLASDDTVLFNGIRHSSLSSPDLGEDERAESAKNKVEEVIRAALFSKYGKEISDHIVGNKNITEPLGLKLTSTSLLTLMDFKFAKTKETEKTQFEDQMKAFSNAKDELKEIEIDGKKIPIQFDFIQFSTGINNVALGASHFLKAINSSGWNEADKINRNSLITLIGSLDENSAPSGWAGEYLQRDNVTQIQKDKVTLLVNEIRSIFNSKMHHTENKDRFALPKRLVLLTHLIDATPAFNCKSGKDRTGMIDAEVKALAAHLSTQMNSKKLSTEMGKPELFPFYFDPLNFEVQSLNSGLSGNKVMNSNSPYLKGLLTPEEYQVLKGNCNEG